MHKRDKKATAGFIKVLMDNERAIYSYILWVVLALHGSMGELIIAWLKKKSSALGRSK